MGGWEFLVIPIIGVAVWIISTLVRGAEEAKKPGEPGPRKPEKVTDLDRFVREVQRRKRAAERGETPRARRDAPPDEAIAVEREEPRRSRRTAPPDEAIAVVLPVVPVPAAEPVTRAPVMRTVVAPPLPVMPAELPSGALPPRPESPGLVALRGLLSSREGLRNAIILQEVFGPPRSRRRQGRGK